MNRRVVSKLCVVFANLWLVTGAAADDNRPLFVEITELDPGSYRIGLRVPPTIPAFNQPTVALPCTEMTASHSTEPDRQSGMSYRHVACDGALQGRSIEIQYPVAPPAVATVVRVNWLPGHSQTIVLPPGQYSWQVPDQATRSSVAGDYLWLGMYHIWVGVDHLLFLVCLICIAGTCGRTLATITGFTIAHSLTLALSALQIVRLPVPPIEAVIALSVVFLATEVAKGRRENLTWRYPITVSSTFGLLHGLGFAAALNEIGLPNTELVTGLLFFNIGVEVGQIAFAIPVLLAFALLHRLSPQATDAEFPHVDGHWERQVQRLLGYSTGILASFWLFDRVAGFIA